MPAIIEVKNVSKTFKLPHEKQNSIKGLFVNIFRRRRTYERQEVLKNVSFEVQEGEFYGIVGRNGSGKSTLLKMLAGIYEPNKGHIKINGKLTPFIELGVGFNPNLTGRENVYLNGALLGFNRKQMNAMYDEIVAFAELDKFMDQKLKNYSSGMQVRLAFSIAIRAKSDILLLDEVLAVGDAAFQKKCTEYFVELKNKKQTVVLVTHDMQNVERFCDRVLVLDYGKQIGVYDTYEAQKIYSQLNRKNDSNDNQDELTIQERWGSGRAKLASATINGSKSKRPLVNQGGHLEIDLAFAHSDNFDEPVVVGLGIYDEGGTYMAGPNTADKPLYGKNNVKYSVAKNPLNPGLYRLEVAIFNKDLTEEYDHLIRVVDFEVTSDDHKHYGKIDLFGEWSAK